MIKNKPTTLHIHGQLMQVKNNFSMLLSKSGRKNEIIINLFAVTFKIHLREGCEIPLTKVPTVFTAGTIAIAVGTPSTPS